MTRKINSCIVLLLLVIASSAHGQTVSQALVSVERSPGSLWVTVSAGEEQMRFATLGLVQRLRLEVIDQRGERVYDSDYQRGNLLDWKMEGQGGQKLPDGVYGCVVTVEDLSGQTSRRQGILWLDKGKAQIVSRAAGGTDPSALAQELVQLTVLRDDEGLPIAHLAHNGEIGLLASGKGGLSFRAGDIFSGRDVEHMRLTADGRLGIGTEEPKARLDVAGLIRTTEGIMFPDGTIQRTASNPLMGAIGLIRDARSRSDSGRSTSTGQDRVAGSASARRQQSPAQGFSMNFQQDPGLILPYLTTGNQSFSGQLCFGMDCLDPETWLASENVRLKQNNNRMAFIDTSVLAGFPAGDWQFRFNGNLTGGTDFFAVDWLGTAATTANESPVSTPFLIEGAAPSNSLYIKQTGNIGIGTTNPNTKLDVIGAIRTYTPNENTANFTFKNDSAPSSWQLSSYNVGDLRITEAGIGPRMVIRPTSGNVGIGSVLPAAKLEVVGSIRAFPTDENTAGFWLANQSAPSAWQMSTYNSGKLYINEAGVATRMVIASSTGNVGIGTTDPSYKLHVVGSIYATGSLLSSDARLKKNISDLRYGLYEILQLHPVSYLWKDQSDSKLSLGLIAQEVEPIFPELVERAKDENGTMSLNYVGLVPVLVKAMQQQQGKIGEQEVSLVQKTAEIAALKSQNAALDARLSALEQLMERLLKQEGRQEK